MAALLACLAGCAPQERGQPDAGAAIGCSAFGSCAFQWGAQPSFRPVAAAEPDLHPSLGDAIYGDSDGEIVFETTPQSLRAEWAKLAASSGRQALRARVPVMAA